MKNIMKLILGLTLIGLLGCGKENKCTSGVEHGKIEGTVKLAGTGDPVEGVTLQLDKNIYGAGWPSSVSYEELDTTASNSNGFYSFSDYETVSTDYSVWAFFDTSLYYSCLPTNESYMKESGCGIKQDFEIIPKAYLKLNIGDFTVPQGTVTGSFYNRVSGHILSFDKENPPSGSIRIPVKGNTGDEITLTLKKKDWVVTKQYPDGIYTTVTDTIIHYPIWVKAWEEESLEINYP